MKAYQYNTKHKNMKKLWNLLKSVNLDGLLTGGTINIAIDSLLKTLFETDMVNQFCQLITDTQDDFEDLQMEDLVAVIAGFFTTMKGSFKQLKSILTAEVQNQKGGNIQTPSTPLAPTSASQV